jgi:hypothetical protein
MQGRAVGEADSGNLHAIIRNEMADRFCEIYGNDVSERLAAIVRAGA